jgi:hypothetical protein
MPSRTSLLILSLVALAMLPATRAPAAPDVQSLAQFSTRPDALLSVDMNRSAVVERITAAWSNELLPAQRDSFKSKLSSLRADGLLAASLSGSFDGVLEIINSLSLAENVSSPSLASAQSYFASQSELKSIANSFIPAAQNTVFMNQSSQNLSADSAKALGDANADLVYTPLVPCRLFDTRAGLASALGTVGGTFSNQQTKTISPAGACGIPTSGVASLFLSFHAYNNNPSTLGVIGFMAPGTTFSALAATWTGASWATGTFITRTNPNGSFDAFVGNGQAMTADMIVDVMGYFRAPQGTIAAGSGDITDVLTAAGSGLTGGVTSGAANLSIASTYKLPQACANGQVAKYNTATLVWECANDLQGTGAGGAGTVTNIATGAGLLGGPITSTGTINLASTQLLPTTACAANQIPKWNGASWACAADATGASGGSGTVTSVATGAGLTGGPITAAGTIGLAASQLLPTTACGDSQTLIWNATSSNWICAAWAPPGGGAANAFVNGGNSFGGPALVGTTDATTMSLRSGGNGAYVNLVTGGGLSVSRYGAALDVNIVNGSIYNGTSSGVEGVTISGGGKNTSTCGSGLPTNDRFTNGCEHSVFSSFSTVGGGIAHRISLNSPNSTIGGGKEHFIADNSAHATISGGNDNYVAGRFATVSGGFLNEASGLGSVVSGGSQNTASGERSIVPGGYANSATGSSSFAAGQLAVAGDRTFVWNSYNTTNNLETRTDSFRVQAANGFDVNYGANKQYYVAFNADNPGFIINTSTGIGMSTAGVWTNQSDRAKKREFAPINAREVLRKVVALPLSTWSYLAEESNIRHMGPMAQDFWKAFGLGYGDKTMNDVDSRGVAFAAIQGLNQKLVTEGKAKDAKISALEKKTEKFEALERASEAMKLELTAIKKKLGL